MFVNKKISLSKHQLIELGQQKVPKWLEKNTILIFNQAKQKQNREEENEECMEIFWKYLLRIDQTYPSKQGMIDLMLNLSTKTSTAKGGEAKTRRLIEPSFSQHLKSNLVIIKAYMIYLRYAL